MDFESSPSGRVTIVRLGKEVAPRDFKAGYRAMSEGLIDYEAGWKPPIFLL